MVSFLLGLEKEEMVLCGGIGRSLQASGLGTCHAVSNSDRAKTPMPTGQQPPKQHSTGSCVSLGGGCSQTRTPTTTQEVHEYDGQVLHIPLVYLADKGWKWFGDRVSLKGCPLNVL